ncbi:hypothetical protein FOZ60_006460 [Perkinsus olseni]|uniref:Uncharacterized protein n=2 Tax=Perkinsus olseni TaxID=32597 RepID=A0A7J6PG13_PEROL|nr:hypothetical protein FOZ60_006460 [Perkinsus olseni]
MQNPDEAADQHTAHTPEDASDGSIIEDEVSLACSPHDVMLREANEERLPKLLSEDSPVFDPTRPPVDRIPLSICKGLTFVETPTASSEKGEEEDDPAPQATTGLPPPTRASPPTSPTPSEIVRKSALRQVAEEFVPSQVPSTQRFWDAQQRYNIIGSTIVRERPVGDEEKGKDHKELKQEYEQEKALRRLARDPLKAFPDKNGKELYGLSPLPQPFALPEVMTIKPSYYQLQPPPAPPSPPSCFNTYRMETLPAMLLSSPFLPSGGYPPPGGSGFSMPPGINPLRHARHAPLPHFNQGPRLPPVAEDFRPQWDMTGMTPDQVAAASARRAMTHYHHHHHPMSPPPMDPHLGHHHHYPHMRPHYPPHVPQGGMPMGPLGYPQRGPLPPMPTNWAAVPHSRPLNSNAPPFVQTSRYHPLPPQNGYHGDPPLPPGGPLPPPPIPHVAAQPQPGPPLPNPGPVKRQEAEPDGGIGILWEDRQRTPPSPPGRLIYLDITGRERVDEEKKRDNGDKAMEESPAPDRSGFFCPLREHLAARRLPSLAGPRPLTRDGVESMGRLPRTASPVWQSVKLLGVRTSNTPLDEALIAPLEPLMPPEMFDENKEGSELFSSAMRSYARLRSYYYASPSLHLN